MTGGNLHHQYEMDRLLVDACAYWSAQNALRMIWRYPEMAFCDQVELNFPHDNTIEMQRSVNMNSEARSRPLLTATQERKGENQ